MLLDGITIPVNNILAAIMRKHFALPTYAGRNTMSEVKHGEFSRVLRIFISSSTTEMELFRNQAIQAIRDARIQHTNFNDPGGAGISHRDQTIFEMNRDTIHQADVFFGLYGFGGVWRPASHPGLTVEHPELLDDPDKLIMEYEYEEAMIVVVTPDSVQSRWVEKECKEFRDMGKRVFPYIADSEYINNPEKLPDYLEKLQYIDGTESNGFNELVRQLRGVLDH
jgi:hypothetical protein